MDELTRIKVLIGDVAEDDDDLLTVLLDLAQEIIESYTRFPNDYKHLKTQAVIAAYNQLGAEGTESTSGRFSQSWAYSIMSQMIYDNMPAQLLV